MAILNSTGVDVQIINESFYGSGGAGTVPLIVIATATNKASASGSGIAEYTTDAQAGVLREMTSQRDLLAKYGTPLFWQSQGTPLHGYELNEVGLHQAWSVLGVQNKAYVLRAGIDLAALVPSDSAPVGQPVNGTYWFDLSTTAFGVFRSNGNANPGYAWGTVTPLVAGPTDVDTSNVLKSTFGANGDFAINPRTTGNILHEKIAGAWLAVGTTQWAAAKPTVITGIANPAAVSGVFTINGTAISTLTSAAPAAVIAAVNAITASTGVSAAVVNNAVVLTHAAGASITLANTTATPLATLGLTAGTRAGVSLTFTNDASYPTGTASGSIWIKMTEPAKGTKFVVKTYSAASAQWVSIDVPAFKYDASRPDSDAAKDAAARTGFGLRLVNGAVYVAYDDASTARVRTLRRYNAATGHFEDLVYEASKAAPVTAAPAGALWFSNDMRTDIMVGNGQNWKGYRNAYPGTDIGGVIISANLPAKQSDGGALATGDIWLDSSDTENYPALRRYDAVTGKWGLIDNTDQTTPFGIVFADARQNSGVAFTGQTVTGYDYGSEDQDDLTRSDFVDPDAPDARLYPSGTLLFNTRYATNNVKAWTPYHFLAGNFDANTNYTATGYTVGSTALSFPATTAGRWVTVSGNKVDGSPYMGRKAQRAMIVRSMQEAVASNEEIRAPKNHFTLVTAPGYPELLDELANMNREKNELATIIPDHPVRLTPAAAALWAANSKGAAENGEDGLTTKYEYAAAYYGWGYTQNADGSNVVVPSSTLAVRVMLYNDQVGHPWFSPAGVRRGKVLNATSIGYLSAEGEFVAISLTPGQSAALSQVGINPIEANTTYGLIVNGQKTLTGEDTVLNRVQGARLANYIRYQLAIYTYPFLHEQNDPQTRETAAITVRRFFNGLMSLRALEDYAVLCDETNNTPERRQRHELWIDVAVKPIGAVEFIYIPVRFRQLDAEL